mmetsp:Transcript_11054/g.16632  ORF Transcript_11054/g.16632 Transcript_11054/m.16632 type:complete len:94 (+) Transcript_11054:1702-1983(+)
MYNSWFEYQCSEWCSYDNSGNESGGVVVGSKNEIILQPKMTRARGKRSSKKNLIQIYLRGKSYVGIVWFGLLKLSRAQVPKIFRLVWLWKYNS